MSVLKNILISSLITITLASSLTCYADVAVNGYYKKDGTYVKPHMRSDPDSNFYNNWSTVGNINPYTGKKGTKTTPNYNQGLTQSSSVNPYVGRLSSLNNENISSLINDNNLIKPHDTQTKSNHLIELRDYQTVQLESTLKTRIDNIDWYHMSESKTDIAYVRRGIVGYFNSYPTVSVMYKGATQLNKRPAWLGTRFIKVIVDCRRDKIALVADAILNSNGEVVSDIDYPENGKVVWSAISDFFDTNLFKSKSKACVV